MGDICTNISNNTNSNNKKEFEMTDSLELTTQSSSSKTRKIIYKFQDFFQNV